MPLVPSQRHAGAAMRCARGGPAALQRPWGSADPCQHILAETLSNPKTLMSPRLAGGAAAAQRVGGAARHARGGLVALQRLRVVGGLDARMVERAGDARALKQLAQHAGVLAGACNGRTVASAAGAELPLDVTSGIRGCALALGFRGHWRPQCLPMVQRAGDARALGQLAQHARILTGACNETAATMALAQVPPARPLAHAHARSCTALHKERSRFCNGHNRAWWNSLLSVCASAPQPAAVWMSQRTGQIPH